MDLGVMEWWSNGKAITTNPAKDVIFDTQALKQIHAVPFGTFLDARLVQ